MLLTALKSSLLYLLTEKIIDGRPFCSLCYFTYRNERKFSSESGIKEERRKKNGAPFVGLNTERSVCVRHCRQKGISKICSPDAAIARFRASVVSRSTPELGLRL